MKYPKVIIELDILKVNGISGKELADTKGFKKGATAIIDNLVKELPNHFRKFRMETKASGRLETFNEEKKNG